MNQCKARGCKVEVDPTLLMCREHWAMVPNGIKNEVNRAWRAFIQGKPNRMTTEQRARYVRAYQDARRKAINAVAEQEGLPA